MSAFRTTQGRANPLQINFRNHRKVVVVDGHSAYIGGHNVGEEYVGRHPRLTPWRDTHLHIQGPAAMATQLAFVEDWYWATRQVPELDWVPNTVCTPGQRVLILPTGPADVLDTCVLFFVQAINTAQQRIWITSPYFVPDEMVVAALQLAALRGVDVRIMLPEHPDHRLVYLAGLAFVQETVSAGVQLFRYQSGFLHQKVLLVDNDLAAVGTANLDNRSFRLNFEFTALIADHAFAAQVADMLSSDFAHCRRVAADELEVRPLAVRVAARAARLLVERGGGLAVLQPRAGLPFELPPETVLIHYVSSNHSRLLNEITPAVLGKRRDDALFYRLAHDVAERAADLRRT